MGNMAVGVGISSCVVGALGRSVADRSISAGTIVPRDERNGTRLVYGDDNVVYNLNIFRHAFALLSRGTGFRADIGSNSFIRGKVLLNIICNSVETLLSNRHATLGCLREVDKVTAVAGRCTGRLRNANAALLSAEGAAPGVHPFRGCTMAINNNGGRHCGLSSKILLGSGRVKTTNSIAGTVGTTGRCTPFMEGVRVRARAFRRIRRTIRTKTSVVVLSGVDATRVTRYIGFVGNETRARYDKGIAGRELGRVTTANISFISYNTLARSTPVVSMDLGGLIPVRWVVVVF